MFILLIIYNIYNKHLHKTAVFCVSFVPIILELAVARGLFKRNLFFFSSVMIKCPLPYSIVIPYSLNKAFSLCLHMKYIHILFILWNSVCSHLLLRISWLVCVLARTHLLPLHVPVKWEWRIDESCTRRVARRFRYKKINTLKLEKNRY